MKPTTDFERGRKYVANTFDLDRFCKASGIRGVDREQIEIWLAHCYAAGIRHARKRPAQDREQA